MMKQMVQTNPKAANSKPQNAHKSSSNTQKIPRKITPTYLHNAGLYYLGRFSASSAHFRTVMRRKVQKSCAHHTDQNFEHCMEMVDTLIDTFLRAGLLNDEIYAQALISSLRRRGKSLRAIQAALQTKGVPGDLVSQKVMHHDMQHGENAAETEFKAALAHARKRKLGPFRTSQEPNLKKDLANMARAGFSYETARRVFSANSETSNCSHILDITEEDL